MAHAAQHTLAAHTNAAHPSGGVPAYQYVAPGMFTEILRVDVMTLGQFADGAYKLPLALLPSEMDGWVVTQLSDGIRVAHPDSLTGRQSMREHVLRSMPHCPLVLGTWKPEAMGSGWVWRFHGEGGVIEAR